MSDNSHHRLSAQLSGSAPSRSTREHTRGAAEPHPFESNDDSLRSSQQPIPHIQRTASGQGTGIVSTRTSARRPGYRNSASFSKSIDMSGEQIATRGENEQLVDDLKEQLQRTEAASRQYQKQLEMTQSRLDEIFRDQLRMEEERESKSREIEGLKAEAKDHLRRYKDLGEANKHQESTILAGKEAAARKDEEHQAIIMRLSETIKQMHVVDESARAPAAGKRSYCHIFGSRSDPVLSFDVTRYRNSPHV